MARSRAFGSSPTRSSSARSCRWRPPQAHSVPFTLRNLKEDLGDVGSNFGGAPDLEFRMATKALALEQSGLSYQSNAPGTARTRTQR
jgi:hypothetical protein